MSLRAALYARVSKTMQDEALQLRELRRVADQRGWTVVREIVDRVSTLRARRPGLDELLELTRRGQVDVVAVWRLDRLARSSKHLQDLGETFAAQRVDLISVRDGAVDTTTPTGRLLFAMLGAVAAFERDLIRERAMAGQALAQERGVHCGRPRSRPELSQAAAQALVVKHGSRRAAARAAGMSRPAFLRRLGVSESLSAALSKNPPSSVSARTPSPPVRKPSLSDPSED